jgi:hypothetical protein
MSNDKIITLFKIVMVFGILLILTGVYLHIYEPRIEAMGVTGILISVVSEAFSKILSLPTKMFMTFLLVKLEADMNNSEAKLLK